MDVLKSILANYGIISCLVKNEENLEIVILKRKGNLSLDRWINMISSIKYKFQKNIDFFLESDALKLYGDLKSFTLLENDYE